MNENEKHNVDGSAQSGAVSPAQSHEAELLEGALLEGIAEEEVKEEETLGTDNPSATADALEQRGERLGVAVAQAQKSATVQAATSAAKANDRKRHVGVIIAVVAFVVLLIGAGVAYGLLAPQTGREVEVTGTDAAYQTEVDTSDTGDGNGENAASTPAPSFTMTDNQGKTMTLDDFKGRPILLNFWASWCGPCQSEMPAIQESWEAHGQQIEFLIVNMTGMSGETEESAKAFLADTGYTFPVYFDAHNSAATTYGVTSIPQTYLIDEAGNIVGSYVGAMDDAVLAQGIDMLLSAN